MNITPGYEPGSGSLILSGRAKKILRGFRRSVSLISSAQKVRILPPLPNLESVQQTKSIQLVIETAKTILLYIALVTEWYTYWS